MSHKTQKPSPNKQEAPLPKSSNKTWFLLLAALGLGFLSFILIQFWPSSTIPADFVPQVEGAPSILVLSEPVINHGNLLVNEFVTSTFQIQNVGDEALIILSPWVRVHEGCCPPEAVISNQRLQPGEIATVSMRYTMHAGMDGPHDLRIHLESNDPANPEIELTALSNWQS